MRYLCCQFVEIERRDQADHSLGNPLCDFGKLREAADFAICKPVQPTTYSLKKALLVKLVEILASDAQFVQIPWAQDALLASKFKNSLPFRGRR
jgi:hypothetical protein